MIQLVSRKKHEAFTSSLIEPVPFT